MKLHTPTLAIFATASAFLSVSCSPSSNWNAFNRSGIPQTGSRQVVAGNPAGQRQDVPVSSSTGLTANELKELREKREGLGSNAGSSSAGRAATSAPATSAEDQLPPLPSIERQYSYAIPVPGRPGWVWNPYTNKPVDVRGVEAGKLIYDEWDPANRYPDGTLMPVDEMPNKFRVPRARVY